MRCDRCGREVATKPTKTGRERLPRGWVRLPEEVLCGGKPDRCFELAYLTRALEMPVHSVLGLDWKEFALRVRGCWDESTELANWSIDTLRRHDLAEPRAGDPAKLPARPPVYLYGLFNTEYTRRASWTGAAGAALAVMKTAEAYYQKERLAILWYRERNYRNYRFPQPYPVDADMWEARLEEVDAGGGLVPLVDMTLPGGRLTLRLRGGPNFARQLRLFRELAGRAGQDDALRKALQCEACLLGKPIGGDSAQVVTWRAPRGGRRQRYRIFVKLVLHTARSPAPDRPERVLYLATAPDRFWVAQLDGRSEPFVFNADHLVRLERELPAEIERHRRFLQRIAEDTKYEKRWPKRRRLQINEFRAIRCQARDRKTDSYIKEACASLASFAARQRVTKVVYDDSCRSYLPSFPYAQVRQRLKQNLALKPGLIGLVLVSASGAASDESLGAARQEESL